MSALSRLLFAGLLPLAAVPVLGQTVSTYTLPVARPTQGYVYSGWEAYNPTQPVPEPGPPNPLPASMDFTVTLDYSGNPTAGPAVKGTFMGISIEMSLVEEIIGRNASWVRPQFLNLMSALKSRGGAPLLRVGGNSADKAGLKDEIDGGKHSTERILDTTISSNTKTPILFYTEDIFKAMRQVSDLLQITWLLGLPFDTTVEQEPRLQIAEVAEPILGDYLLSWQLGNEPDLYADNQKRNKSYNLAEYLVEFEYYVNKMHADNKVQNRKILGGPNFCECGGVWSAADVMDQSLMPKFPNDINTFMTLHYPANNCPTTRPRTDTIEEQTIALFAGFAQHWGPQSVTTYAVNYVKHLAVAQKYNIPLILIETNTAACNGFLGLSDSFLAALWTLDLGLHLPSIGFTNAMVHLGGQRSFYNPFVHPPWNATEPFMWTIGAPWYGILITSEVLGPSGKARVQDIGLNGNNTNMAGYVIYEDNKPVRMVLINFMTDQGAGNLAFTARVNVQGATQVRTRLLRSDTNKLTSKKGWYYANQTYGSYFESDGLMRGDQFTDTVACDNGVCPIKVPAPGAMVVFLTSDLVYDATSGPAMQTFATSTTTRMLNTASPSPDVLETSNGLSAEQRALMHNAKTSRDFGGAGSHNVPFAAAVSAVVAFFAGFVLLRV